MDIHIGDYIEGYELIGNATLSKICRMRVVVSQIYGEVDPDIFMERQMMDFVVLEEQY